MAGCLLLNKGQSSMTINGEETCNASRSYLDKNGTGETGIFQNLLSKLPYFKHKW